mgnify:CR=1 FL=1
MADTRQTDKDKGRQMLQKVGAEAIGTFALVFAGCGAIMVDAMSAGAWGLSTGLDYPPGAYANTTELAGLARAAARYGGFYHTHIRSSLRQQGPLVPWDEALEIGRRGDCPCQDLVRVEPG